MASEAVSVLPQVPLSSFSLLDFKPLIPLNLGLWNLPSLVQSTVIRLGVPQMSTIGFSPIWTVLRGVWVHLIWGPKRKTNSLLFQENRQSGMNSKLIFPPFPPPSSSIPTYFHFATEECASSFFKTNLCSWLNSHTIISSRISVSSLLYLLLSFQSIRLLCTGYKHDEVLPSHTSPQHTNILWFLLWFAI